MNDYYYSDYINRSIKQEIEGHLNFPNRSPFTGKRKTIPRSRQPVPIEPAPVLMEEKIPEVPVERELPIQSNMPEASTSNPPEKMDYTVTVGPTAIITSTPRVSFSTHFPKNSQNPVPLTQGRLPNPSLGLSLYAPDQSQMNILNETTAAPSVNSLPSIENILTEPSAALVRFFQNFLFAKV